MCDEGNITSEPKQVYQKQYHTNEDKLEALENRIAYLERDLNRTKVRMITWGELIGFLAVVFILLFWGDKVWGYIQSLFVSISSSLRRIIR